MDLGFEPNKNSIITRLGQKISDQELATIPLKRRDSMVSWNYTQPIKPQVEPFVEQLKPILT